MIVTFQLLPHHLYHWHHRDLYSANKQTKTITATRKLANSSQQLESISILFTNFREDGSPLHLLDQYDNKITCRTKKIKFLMILWAPVPVPLFSRSFDDFPLASSPRSSLLSGCGTTPQYRVTTMVFPGGYDKLINNYFILT